MHQVKVQVDLVHMFGSVDEGSRGWPFLKCLYMLETAKYSEDKITKTPHYAGAMGKALGLLS